MTTTKGKPGSARNGPAPRVVIVGGNFAGDAADLPNLKSKQAYHAIEMGEWVAKSIKLLVAGENPADFRPSSATPSAD